MVILLILAVLILLADIGMFVRMLSLLRKCKEETVETFDRKIRPYLRASCVLSVFLSVCMIALVLLR